MANYGWAASNCRKGGKASQGAKGGIGGRGRHRPREAPQWPQLQGRQKKGRPRHWQNQQRSRSCSHRQDHQQSRSCRQHSRSRHQQSRSQRQPSRSKSRCQQSRSSPGRSRSRGRSQAQHQGQKCRQSRSGSAYTWLQGAVDTPASPDAQGQSSASQGPPLAHLLPHCQTSQVPTATAGEMPQRAGAMQPSQSTEDPGRRVLVRMPSDTWMAMSGTDVFKPYLGKPVSFHREGDVLFAVIHDDAPAKLLPADPGAEMPRGSAASASPGAQGAPPHVTRMAKQQPMAAKPAHIFGSPNEPPGKPKRQQQ